MKLIINDKKIEIIECKTYLKRLKGFMFYKNPIEYGLLFKNCDSIHTFFMYQNIDVIMCDKNNKVLSIYVNLKPNNILFCKKASNIYELPAYSVNSIKIGDYLNIK